ncbi:protein-tyrosine-phosphatase OS=Tsukamurella paurometabola (strain ATCC 8368 / DSM / CCUG 35730/ CIP 100753 / JCM 10117 / KCTC 9821 / NBRC 16120 / NCIMB 702349 / NCTC 13040) OX=521096 GN=Tpau_2713 PE=3 SV=1 [Tsukamurella paurometabola]|uniref:protein-tyrosine-phosphatase n=1 Tax=Tsukamurella paurometabola (strain ATCC 8368 / DSM 20162 / CCUG 35730 / CIP 100753 / JCM 10117 / KCTC 9821 / NBRC 16120 / NCIMB 702349 / NCTC 13040) TaxID=521096 RepID=D5USP0_TSUPD|nr:low molecular weight protein-tyrosine-phosphatase [Tsukamurella paurometabola]ADG79311.1 protein tyrosine phosphatase [Tsukamurella paurometabola DSM 20162]SUP35033.1 Probable low molecular weight protein-tyrosine-phosphatase [Tsukamurella paurometabola]
MNTPLHVTFVCTGNICRSPIARIVYERAVAEAGLADRVRVTSAGTGGWHEGDPADHRARAVLAEAGYPTDHAAAEVTADHLGADLVVALHRSHVEPLRGLGVPAERLELLRAFDPDAPTESVADPYYGDLDDFRQTLTQVEAAMPGLIEWTRRHA